MQIRQIRLAENPDLLPVLVASVAALGFGVLAYFASTVTNFPGEVSVSIAVQSLGSGWFQWLMEAISVPGILVVALPSTLVAAAALYIKGWRAECVVLLAACGGGRLVMLVKEVVDRPRPTDDLVMVLRISDSGSFPSGHVAHYTVFLGALLVILMTRMKPGIPLRLAQSAIMLALIGVGISRIYLGAHWLSDVLGAYIFGALVVASVVWVWRRWGQVA